MDLMDQCVGREDLICLAGHRLILTLALKGWDQDLVAPARVDLGLVVTGGLADLVGRGLVLVVQVPVVLGLVDLGPADLAWVQ